MARDPHFRPDRDWRDYDHPAMHYQPPKLLRRFRAGAALVVSTLLVVGVWSLGWYGAAHYVKSQVTGWSEAQVARGGPAGFESLELAGFPNRIRLTLNKPRYLGPVAGHAVQWGGETLTLSTRPWTPWRLHFEASGRHTLALTDAGLNLQGAVTHLSADVVTGDVWPAQLVLDIEGLKLGGDAAVVMDSLHMDLAHDAGVKVSGEGLRLTLVGTNLTLPLHGGWGLGDTIASLDADLAVHGPVQIYAGLAGPLSESLSAWRDVGGAVQVERLKARIGPLAIATVGTLTLDDTLQPVAAFSAKFEGLFQVLEILRKRGVVRGGDAVFATMALSALSKRPAGGGPSTINLAVGVQNSKFMLGPIPLVTLPTLNWGAPAQPVQPSAPLQPAKRDYKAVPQIY